MNKLQKRDFYKLWLKNIGLTVLLGMIIYIGYILIQKLP